MQRRSVCSLLLSGASAAALAACGGSTLIETEKEEPAAVKEEAKAEPTAAPAEAQPTAEPEAKAEPEPTAAPTLDLPNLGKAPEVMLTGWFNSEPITMASLEGKAAAMIVFWTYT
jgi:hypothetical protein